MAVWKVQRLGAASSLTGEPFPPDAEVVTALFGEEEEAAGEDRVKGSGFVRRDYLAAEATPERLQGAYCVWRTRTPAAKPEDRRRLDLGMAREFLARVLAEGREDRAAVAFALALLLARKKRLHVVREGDGFLEVRWPKEDATFRVPAPVLTEADEASLQQELARLFDVA
jgi:hypothetical protein